MEDVVAAFEAGGRAGGPGNVPLPAIVPSTTVVEVGGGGGRVPVSWTLARPMPARASGLMAPVLLAARMDAGGRPGGGPGGFAPTGASVLDGSEAVARSGFMNVALAAASLASASMVATSPPPSDGRVAVMRACAAATLLDPGAMAPAAAAAEPVNMWRLVLPSGASLPELAAPPRWEDGVTPA